MNNGICITYIDGNLVVSYVVQLRGCAAQCGQTILAIR